MRQNNVVLGFKSLW